MTKFKLITDFSRYTADGLISFGNHVYISLLGNAHLDKPVPPLGVLKTFIDNLTVANSKTGDNTKEGTAIKESAVEALVTCLKSLASYVQENSKNDAPIMLSAGFELTKAKTRLGPMPMPENLTANCIKGIQGSVKLTVAPVLKANGYIWQFTEHPLTGASEWQLAFSTAANITLALKSRTEYVFCVAATGSNPTKTYSEKLTFFVV